VQRAAEKSRYRSAVNRTQENTAASSRHEEEQKIRRKAPECISGRKASAGSDLKASLLTQASQKVRIIAASEGFAGKSRWPLERKR